MEQKPPNKSQPWCGYEPLPFYWQPDKLSNALSSNSNINSQKIGACESRMSHALNLHGNWANSKHQVGHVSRHQVELAKQKLKGFWMNKEQLCQLLGHEIWHSKGKLKSWGRIGSLIIHHKAFKRVVMVEVMTRMQRIFLHGLHDSTATINSNEARGPQPECIGGQYIS